jgi:hypothetical protein
MPDLAGPQRPDRTPVSAYRVLLAGYSTSPSPRLRFSQYSSRFADAGVELVERLVPQGDAGALEALLDCLRDDAAFDAIVVQRILDRRLNRLLKDMSPPVIFDVDDALHVLRTTQRQQGGATKALKSTYRRLVRGAAHVSSGKTILADMLRLASLTIVGNDWLRAQYSPYANHTVVVPTSVEILPELVREPCATVPLRIGWVGTQDNLLHIRHLEPALRVVSDRYRDRILLTVISSAPYETDAIATEFVPWTLDGERRAISRFDIGIMPLEDDDFTRGKSAWKAILCMAHAVPVVVSPIGANLTLVAHGINGFLARTAQEWVEHLGALIEDVELRRTVGVQGLETVRQRYSTDASFPTLLRSLQSTFK